MLQGTRSKYSEGGVLPLRWVGTCQSAGSTHTLVLRYDFVGFRWVRFFDALEPASQRACRFVRGRCQ